MRKFINSFRLYLIKLLSAKKVVALQIEGMTVRKDVEISSVSLNFHTLPDRMFASLNIHYVGTQIDMRHFDDLEMAKRNFDFITEMFVTQQKAKGIFNEQRKNDSSSKTV